MFIKICFIHKCTYPSNFLFDNEKANLLSLWLSRLLSNLCSSSIFNNESGLLFWKMKHQTTISALKLFPSHTFHRSSLSASICQPRLLWSDVKDWSHCGWWPWRLSSRDSSPSANVWRAAKEHSDQETWSNYKHSRAVWHWIFPLEQKPRNAFRSAELSFSYKSHPMLSNNNDTTHSFLQQKWRHM